MEYNCVYRPLGIKNCELLNYMNIIVSIGHWR